MNVNLYLRQFFIVASGTAAAQVINLAAYPILTRLYSPTDFGIFALFVTVASVIGIIAAGRFDLILSVWIFGGAFCLLGALCFAELGTMFPEAGGLYAYLRETFGSTVANG